MVKRGNGYKDISGQRFGRLLVIKDSEKRQDKRVIWECLCNCGNTTYVTVRSLLIGNTRSCGCLQAESRGKTLRKNLIGKKFGRLTVLKPIGPKNKKRYWLCKCDCGNLKEVSGSCLVTGKTSSCGCYQLESRTGKNCHLWKGGISKDPYSIGWNGTLREKIRKRDGYICQLCGKKKNKGLCVHHIDYDKKNINPFNLISLCRSCHTKTNHNREDWIFPLQIKSGFWRCFE